MFLIFFSTVLKKKMSLKTKNWFTAFDSGYYRGYPGKPNSTSPHCPTLSQTNSIPPSPLKKNSPTSHKALFRKSSPASALRFKTHFPKLPLEKLKEGPPTKLFSQYFFSLGFTMASGSAVKSPSFMPPPLFVILLF